MKDFYNPNQHYQMRELLDAAARDGAEILIPDLQRSYVWTPDQIILLVDSIFRGWPFGSLLTWKYVTDGKIEDADYGIPARGFYRRYSRTKPQDDFNASYMPPSVCAYGEGYTMVLDGQQRLQSLLLAFYPETRFRLRDYDWYSALKPENLPKRRNHHFSTGILCLDVGAYLAEIKAHAGNCDAISVNKCLKWATASRNASECSARRQGTEYPLPSLGDNSLLHYIPLYFLWQMSAATDDVELLSNKIEKLLSRQFVQIEWLDSHDVILLAKFVKQLNHVGKTDIHCLEIKPCHYISEVDDKDGRNNEKRIYDDAIVNIFTRLNTAGRALTSQEITYAWLKRGWQAGRQTFTKASDLVDEIRSQFVFMNIADDDAISLLSMVWCINCREDGKPLGRRDFLNGEIVRPMAAFLSHENRPDIIAQRVVDFVPKVSEVLEGSYLNSFNAVQIAFGFYWILSEVKQSIANCKRLLTTERDALDGVVDDLLSGFMDRWLFVSAFSGRWSSNGSEYFAALSRILSRAIPQVRTITSITDLEAFAKSVGESLMGTAIDSARGALEFSVSDRNIVSQYRTRLVAWQRISVERADFRNLTFGNKGGEELQVDHVIPHKGWEDYLDHQFDTGNLTVQAALDLFGDYLSIEKDSLLKPEMANVALSEAKAAGKAFINSIGNCALLKWRYNGAKSRTNYDDFMANVYEAQNDPGFLAKWAECMYLTEPFLHPFTKESEYKESNFSVEEFVSAIKKREQMIFADLRKFINGDIGYSKLN